MDKSHHEQLPLIARLMDDVFHVAQSWIEPQASTGETIDVLSYAERGVMLSDIAHIMAGMVIVSEYKSSVADLRKDADKPWRQQGARAIGDLRLYWLRKDGDVRPEHVDDGNGWGVVSYDDYDAKMVRRPQLYHSVAVWSQTALLMKLASRKARYASGGAAQKRQAAHKDVKHAEALVADGPLSTGQIKRFIGWDGTPAKLEVELRKSNLITPPQFAGGNWTMKEDVIDPQKERTADRLAVEYGLKEGDA